jgi:ubiquinone/menaquinone biosynthesis C-methylase UbiE
MSSFDVYAMTDKLNNAVLDVIITRLETRAKHPRFQQMLHEYLNAMNIQTMQRVLDLGCGTGVAARAIAQNPSFTGELTGIDLSPYLIAAAQRLSEGEGVGDRIVFQVGDSRSLDLPAEHFDAVIAHTLVSHVDDPLAVLKEAARLVKPGGLVSIFDGDYASLTFSHEDVTKGKVYDEAIQQAVVTSPRVMRQMPRLLREAGLEFVTSFSYILAEMGKADFWVTALESCRKLLPQSGVMTDEEANAWVDARLQESAEGVFFGASNYYSYVARRVHKV